MSEQRDKVYPVSAEAMKRFVIRAMDSCGLNPEDAAMVADTLVQADLRGVHSHGVMKVPYYVRGYEVGGVNPKPEVRTVTDSGAIAVMDGDEGLGLVTSGPAMRLAMEKAGRLGVGAVTMRKSNHNGMIAYWAMMALEQDMIGYTSTSARPIIPPWGGTTASYGNNPCAYAIPAGEEWPIVLDMALSVVAFGKIRLAEMKGEPIPEGWALDKEGRPTTDARSALEGLLLPMAGYKGYGLALVHEILTGVLSGGTFGTDVAPLKLENPHAPGMHHFFMAFDVGQFMPVAEFKERVDRLVRMMKSSELAEGCDKIFLPGERASETRRKRLREGIPYGQEVIDSLKEFARKRGISHDF